MNKPRLIDANELLDKIPYPWDADDALYYEKVIKAINEQPTAYDIDKVVEQLKQEQKNPNSYVYAWDAYNKAIEIVKGQFTDVDKMGGGAECVVDVNKTLEGGAE